MTPSPSAQARPRSRRDAAEHHQLPRSVLLLNPPTMCNRLCIDYVDGTISSQLRMNRRARNPQTTCRACRATWTMVNTPKC